MTICRVPGVVAQGQDGNLAEIILGEPDGPIEDSYQGLALDFLRIRVRTVTFQAQAIGGSSAQEMRIVAAMGFVTRCTTLLESRLMRMLLVPKLREFRVAAQAGIDGIGLGE